VLMSGATEAKPAYKLVQVPAGTVIPGDRIRDSGMMRQITTIEPSYSRCCVELVFELVAGHGARLVMPSAQDISVWRRCRER